MKALLWKEFQENLKWAVLPVVLIFGIFALGSVPPLLKQDPLMALSAIAAVFGAALGFLQVFFEARGDRRALLLHRPVSHSQVFLAKVIAGLSLYLVALGIPFAFAVAWAATPGHFAAPFRWGMALPWLADSLTGVVYYFAGMLAAGREARWYGSRCLGLPAAFLGSFLVWTLPEFWHALGAIALLGGVVGVAAWGSFLTGGAYAPQPRVSKVALAVTFLTGLVVLSVAGKTLVGVWSNRQQKSVYTMDWTGRVLVASSEGNAMKSVTDLDGQEPEELRGKQAEPGELSHGLREIEAPFTGTPWPRFRTYRNPGRFAVQVELGPSPERWYYVPAEGRLLGYDRESKRLVGSIGPDGFAPPGHEASARFEGEPFYASFVYEVFPATCLALPGGVYAVDFPRRTIHRLFTPAAGETVQGALRWRDEGQKVTRVFVLTDTSVHVLSESGDPVFSAPRAYDREQYGTVRVGRLENPERFVIRYEPSVHLWTGAGKAMPIQLVEYREGAEVSRQALPQRLTPTPPAEALFGLVTSPGEAAVLAGASAESVSGAGPNRDREFRPLYFLLVATTGYFLPGAGWDRTADGGLVLAFWGLSLLSAVACALACFLLARRHSFSRARCAGWSLCGLLCGPAGLLLMLALQEWPARVPCPRCARPRVVTRDTCEHCGAAHAPAARDGTEIFEEAAAAPPVAAAAR